MLSSKFRNERNNKMINSLKVAKVFDLIIKYKIPSCILKSLFHSINLKFEQVASSARKLYQQMAKKISAKEMHILAGLIAGSVRVSGLGAAIHDMETQ